MIRKVITTLGSAAILLTSNPLALADDHMDEDAPTAFPVELFTCTYREGRDRSDLDRVIKRFNDWSDENDAKGYNAWLLTPQMTNADIAFDVGWLGAWQDYPTMGASLDKWTQDGGAVSEAFNRVIECDTHVLNTAYTIRAPESDTPPATGVVLFASCTAEEGAEPMDVYNAHVKWEDWLKERAVATSSWAFVPGLGTADPDFGYYLVRSFPNYAGLGNAGHVMYNDGGMQAVREITDEITSCDNSRVYDAELVRSGMSMQ